MTDEEWSESIAKEKKAGVPLLSLEIFDRGDSDCMVKAAFVWDERWANISMDAPPIALWDILRQIFSALR